MEFLKRERVIIVGIRDDLGIDWSFPKETHSEEKLLWDKFVTGEYWERNRVAKSKREVLDDTMRKSVDKLKNQYVFFSPDTNPWITIREALAGVPDPRTVEFNSEHIFRDGARAYSGHTGSYIDEPSKTIKAGGHGVPGGENMIRFENGEVRYLTIFEAKKIQTFPVDYLITGSWTEGMRQLGNAVPVKLANLIGNELIKKLSCKQAIRR